MKELKRPITQCAEVANESYHSTIYKDCTVLMKTLVFPPIFTYLKGQASSAEPCFVGEQVQGQPVRGRFRRAPGRDVN